MQTPLLAFALLAVAVLAGCAGQSREARCQANGHAAGSAELRSCVEALAAQDRFTRSNSLRRTGGPNGD